jgi:hypothetical protein
VKSVLLPSIVPFFHSFFLPFISFLACFLLSVLSFMQFVSFLSLLSSLNEFYKPLCGTLSSTGDIQFTAFYYFRGGNWLTAFERNIFLYSAIYYVYVCVCVCMYNIKTNSHISRLIFLLPGGSDDRISNPGGAWEFFSSTPCPDRLWGPPSLPSNGY